MKTSFAMVLLLAMTGAAAAQSSSNCPPNKPCIPLQTMPAVIRGVVRDAQSHQPIPYVRVVLELERSGYVTEANTDTQGKFIFEQLGHSSYFVRVKMPGFKGTSQTEASCDQRGCRRVDLSLQLTDFVEFNLERLPTEGQTAAAIPPGGAGATLNAKEASIPDAARKEFEKAKGMADDGKSADSVSHFKKAIELYPQYDQAYLGLGMAYMDQKDWKNAEAILTKATQLDANSPGAFLALGTAYAQEKNFAAAEKPLAHGLELNPDVAEGQCQMSLTYWALKKYTESDAHAQKCAQLKPDYAQAHLLLGNLALAKRNPQGALQEYRTYLKLDPNGTYAPAAQQQVSKLERELGPQGNAK